MKEITKIIIYFVIIANVCLMLWILYKGINVGFSGSWVEIISYVLLLILLGINSTLLIVKSKE